MEGGSYCRHLLQHCAWVLICSEGWVGALKGFQPDEFADVSQGSWQGDAEFRPLFDLGAFFLERLAWVLIC